MEFTPEQIENGLHLPISTSDAAGMLRVRVPKNGREYEKAVMTQNNYLVDDWKENVLDKMTTNRKIACASVWPSWCLYLEGKTCIKVMEMLQAGLIQEPPEKAVGFWKELFETSSIEDLHALGSGTVSSGWTIIQTYFKLWYAQQKYEALFSHSDDPLYWEKNKGSCAALLNGEVLPFWDKETFQDVSDKIRTILQIQVQPDSNRYSRLQ